MPKRIEDLKLRCIYPYFKKFLQGHEDLNDHLESYLVGNYTMPPSLALPIIAALTPPEVEFNLTDDNIHQPLDYDEKVDLVVISCFTPQAQRAYEIADEYRKRNTKVILGGIHPTSIPEEALQHADSVCIGEVEPVWMDILRDCANGSMKRIYQATEVFSLENFPIPKRDIFPRDVYKWDAHIVLTTRGCSVRCGGCPIPNKEGTHVRLRPVQNIIDDIKSMPYKEFYFADDTIMLPGKKYSKFLLKIMEQTKELDVSIFLASTMMMIPDPEFYRQLKAGGATSMYTIFGFDRVSSKLFSPECTKQEWQQSIDLVKMNEDAGIHFFASFGIGFDDQDVRVFDRILEFAEQSKIDLAEFYIITPFPGTPLGEQMQREGRILHRNYSVWNHGNIVFKPKNFTENELMDGFNYLWKTFYTNKKQKDTLRSFTINQSITADK